MTKVHAGYEVKIFNPATGRNKTVHMLNTTHTISDVCRIIYDHFTYGAEPPVILQIKAIFKD